MTLVRLTPANWRRFAAALAPMPCSYPGTLAADTEMLLCWLQEQGAVFVATGENDDQILGALAVTMRTDPVMGTNDDRVATDASWWLPVVVDDVVRGQLLAAGEAWAARHGAASFQVTAPAASALGDFYTSAGYAAAARVYRRRLAA